jgi:transcriptional regulator with XRE-family HTH domain
MNEFIRKLREDRDMTLSDLARLLRVSVSYLSDVEHDRRSVSVSLAATLADAMELPKGKLVALVLQEKLDREGLGGLKVTVR